MPLNQLTKQNTETLSSVQWYQEHGGILTAQKLNYIFNLNMVSLSVAMWVGLTYFIWFEQLQPGENQVKE